MCLGYTKVTRKVVALMLYERQSIILKKQNRLLFRVPESTNPNNAGCVLHERAKYMYPFPQSWTNWFFIGQCNYVNVFETLLGILSRNYKMNE